MATILSVIFLDEKWVMKYDLSSLCFIVAGCASIVLLSNKSEAVFEPDEIQELLFSAKTIIYLAICCLIVVIDYLVLKNMLSMLRNFEADALKYDQQLKE